MTSTSMNFGWCAGLQWAYQLQQQTFLNSGSNRSQSAKSDFLTNFAFDKTDKRRGLNLFCFQKFWSEFLCMVSLKECLETKFFGFLIFCLLFLHYFFSWNTPVLSGLNGKAHQMAIFQCIWMKFSRVVIHLEYNISVYHHIDVSLTAHALECQTLFLRNH